MIGIGTSTPISVGIRLVSLGLIVGATLTAASDTADAARRRAVKRAPVAAYSPPSSAIVVDATNGRVLYEKDADGTRFPASITKVMTLYLLFEEIESGRMTLDTPLTISPFAASQSPSKLGLRPGSTIRVEDAIKAVVTKSANDIAVTIAENVSGSESAFAERMTRKARALGMTKTQYRNASGLPNSGQLTSARDLATLGIAIQERFPKYYGYFSTRVFTYAGRSHGNHNKLLGRVEGVDGIKTGFVNASGFNISTSVRRDGRHIVGVVMGGRTGPSRDATMRELIALYLPRAAIDRNAAPVLVADSGPSRAPTRIKPAVVAEMASTRQGADKTSTRSTLWGTTTPGSSQLAQVSTKIAERLSPAPATPAAASAPILPTTVAGNAPATRTPGKIAAKPTPSLDPAPASAPPVQIASADMSGGYDGIALPTAAAPQRQADPYAAEESTPGLAYAPSEPVLAPSLRWIVGAKPVGSSGLARLVETPDVPAARPKTAPGLLELAEVSPADRAVSEPAVSPATVQPQTTASLDDRRASAPTDSEPQGGPARTGWFIQIGASPDADKARELLSKAQRAARVLASAEPFTEPVTKDSATLYRARFAGLDKRSAQLACDALKRADMNCFAIKN